MEGPYVFVVGMENKKTIAVPAELSKLLEEDESVLKAIKKAKLNARRKSAWAAAGRNEHIYNRF